MPIPKKGSIPGRKQRGLGDLLGGLSGLLGDALKGLGKTVESMKNLNLEDLEKLIEAKGNQQAKENISELKRRLEKFGNKGEGLDLGKLIDLVGGKGLIQGGIRGRILGKEFGGDLPLDRKTPTEKFTVKRHEPTRKTEKKPVVEEGTRKPDLDVFDEEDHILIIGDMPGVNEEDIKYELKEKTLRIYTETGRKYEKEIELPAPVTKKVDLNYRNGVLEVKLIKRK